MKQNSSPDWAHADYQRVLMKVENIDADLPPPNIIGDAQDVMAILPGGLPCNSFHFIGLIMMAPLILFMVLCVLFPVIVLQSEWNSVTTPFVAISGSLVLLWTLLKVFRMMLKNRDLFPLTYFVTLGEKGLAMHFARWHLFTKCSKTAIPWQDVRSAETTSRFYFPAALVGYFNVKTLEIVSSNGDRVIIPFRQKSAEHFAEEVLALVREKAPTIEG
jgi:hypothetical protein